jgi:hypothetical protein
MSVDTAAMFNGEITDTLPAHEQGVGFRAGEREAAGLAGGGRDSERASSPENPEIQARSQVQLVREG